MTTKVTMPQLGESVVEGTIGSWLVEEGQHVEKDQPLVEILTDKADNELPAPVAGVVTSIAAKTDDIVAVGEIGLGGELRQVAHLDRRLHEAARMGFRRAIVPPGTDLGVDGLQLLRAPTLAAAVALADVAPT